MDAILGIYSNKQLIQSPYAFDYDQLKAFLDSSFDGLFWIDEDECMVGYLWGIPRFRIEIISKPIKEVIPNREKRGRPEGTGKVDKIIETLSREIKQKIRDNQLSAQQIADYCHVSFPTAQKIRARLIT